MSNLLKDFGLLPADILLPKDADMNRWSVVACDQYTSEPEYWERVKNHVGDAPSTLHLTLPEVYLEQDSESAIQRINAAMTEYVESDLFRQFSHSYLYIERTLDSGTVRKGLIAAVDLERYDYNLGSTSLIRATEGTILDRLPPRVKVRKDAPLELPHIMLLIDDPQQIVIERIGYVAQQQEQVYDFDLMEKGGHITGWALDGNGIDLYPLFKKLATPEAMEKKYGVRTAPLLFAVGDGNHSLATAKQCWENLKPSLTPEEAEMHPARFALCEIVNLHDESLNFEPIHRVLFNVDEADLLAKLTAFYPGSYLGEGEGHVLSYVSAKGEGTVTVPNPKSNLSVGTLQVFLDQYIKENNIKIDYLHGEDTLCTLSRKEGNLGFLLPPMDKSDLFKTVLLDGALPRKTFSMGHANDKRYYLECRKIR